MLAFGLSVDAAVVAVGAGALARMNWRTSLTVAGSFAVFQGLMPVLGLLLGYGFREYLLAYGHIIGFFLLLLVGGKMLLEAFEKEDVESERDITRLSVLLTLSIATSIDAFVVGITFNFIAINIPLALAAIGVVTFLMALLGVYLGTRSRNLLGKRVEVLGAVVLILLAFKVLLGV